MTIIPSQSMRALGVAGQAVGSTILLALKPHWLKAPISIAEFFTFKKREEASIGEGLT